MFGYPSAFVNGNMACGLHQDDVVLRLGDDRAKELGGKPFEPMAGRPMHGYFTAPAEVVADRPSLARWVKTAIEHAASLPPKVKSGAKPKGAAKPKRASAPRSTTPAKKETAAKPSPSARKKPKT